MDAEIVNSDEFYESLAQVQSTEEENQNSLFSHFTVESFGRGGINCQWYDKAIKLLSEQCYEDSILEVDTVLWQKSFSLVLVGTSHERL
jgi:hypothetical protein